MFSRLPLRFSLRNAIDGTQRITAGRPNAIALTVTNTGARDLRLTGGPAAAPDAALTGPSALYLIFGDLIALDALAALRIDAARGWTSRYFPAPTAAWALTPDRSMVLRPGASLTFTLDNVVPKPKTRGHVIAACYRFDMPDAASRLALDVTAPDPKPLPIVFALADAGEPVLISEPGETVANHLSLVIRNPSPHQPLVPADVPWGPSPPRFLLRWIAGTAPGYGALTTRALGARMQLAVAPPDADAWSIEKDDNASPACWVLTPRTHEVLGVGDSGLLRLSLSDLVTDLQPGMTPLSIAWRDVPGYLDGGAAVRLYKTPALKDAVLLESQKNRREGILALEADQKNAGG